MNARPAFRFVQTLLVALTLAAGAVAVRAQVLPPMLCTGSAVAPPVLDPQAASAELGAFILDCAGNAAAPTVSTDFELFLSAELLTTVSPQLDDGHGKHLGRFVGSNAVLFSGVVLEELGSHLSIFDLFVNPSLSPPGTPYTAFVASFGANVVPINNPNQILGVNGDLQVPEPPTAWLVAAATFGALGWRRRLPRAAGPRHPFSGART